MHFIFSDPKTLCQGILLLITNLIFAVTITMMLHKRFNNIATAFSYFLLWECFIFGLHFENIDNFFNILSPFGIVLWAVIMFTDKISIRLLMGFIGIVCTFITDILAALVLSIYNGQRSYDFMDLGMNLVYIGCALFVCFIFVFIWKLITNKKLFSLTNSTYYPFVAFLCSEIIIGACFVYIGLSVWDKLNISQKRGNSTALLLLSVVFIIVTIAVYISVRNNAKLQQLKVDKKILEYQNSTQAMYYEKMQKNTDDTSKIRHDINNLTQVIKIELAQNTTESRAKAEELTDKIDEIMRSTRTQSYCNNKIINTVMFDKSAQAMEKGITISDDIFLEDNLGIDNFDLCRVFINLMDNAINATDEYKGDGKKNIIISCKEADGYLFIKTMNPFTKATKKDIKNKNKNNSLHGYGLKIVGDIANKYNGTLTKTTENNIFSLLLTLKEI